MSDFKGLGRRFASALGLAAVALAAVHFGQPWFMLLIAVGVVLMAREWPELCLAGAGTRSLWRPKPPVKAVVFVAAVVLAFALAATARYGWALAMAGLGAVAVFGLSREMPALSRAFFAAGVPYIVVPASALLYVGLDPAHGARTIYWVFAVVWATDIGGYLVGRTFGGPKLSPAVSPGKTWSGLFGATFAAVLAGAAFAWVAPSGAAGRLALAAVAVSLVAQGGDLAESVVKRHFAVKDSGSIIPGHGGLFDRLDGLVAAVTLVAGAALATGNTGILWQ